MQVQTKQLLTELEWSKRFIETKTTIPILSNVLFESDGNRLTLTSTDLEHAGVTGVDGAGGAPWAVTAPVAKLIQYLKKVDDPEVRLTPLENHWLMLEHGATGKTRVAGMTKDSYPELPKPPATLARLSRLPLAIARASFAISTEESRFTLNGALLESDDDGARLVATDGHRLSLAPLQVRGGGKFSALLPRKMLLEAAPLGDECDFAVDNDHLFLSYGKRRILSRKLTGNFPEWRRVMKDEFPYHVSMPTKSALKALARVAVYADERSHAVRFQIDDSKMTFYAGTVSEGEAEGAIAVKNGPLPAKLPFEAGYNATYVMDFLSRTEFQHVAFCWSDDASGTAEGKRRHGADQAVQFLTPDGWRVCVMPMRI